MRQKTRKTVDNFRVYSLDFGVLKNLDGPALIYYSKFITVSVLHQILQENAESFFNLFGGIDLYLCDPREEILLRRSHIPEIGVQFGREVVEKLYEHFGVGATVQIPTAEFVLNLLTDLAIYLRVKEEKGKNRKRIVSRRLSEDFGVPNSKVHWAYRRILQEGC